MRERERESIKQNKFVSSNRMTDFANRICLMRVKSDCHLHFWFLIKPCHQPWSILCNHPFPPLKEASAPLPPLSSHAKDVLRSTYILPKGWQQQSTKQLSSRVEGHPVTLDPIRRTAFSSIISSCLPGRPCLCRPLRCGWYFDSCCGCVSYSYEHVPCPLSILSWLIFGII